MFHKIVFITVIIKTNSNKKYGVSTLLMHHELFDYY